MEINTPQVSEIKETKKTNWFLIILLILFFSLLSIGGTYYFLMVYEEKEVTIDEEVVIEKEEDVLTQVEEEVEIINTYTNANYPNMEINYPSNWEIEVEEEDFQGREEQREDGILMRVSEVYKDTLMIFSKDGYRLKISFDAFPYITGFQGNCYLEGELDYIRIEEGLARNNEGGSKYVYSGLLYDENYSPHSSWEESEASLQERCGPGDYVALGFSHILGHTKTKFLFTTDYAGDSNANMSAVVSAVLEISGEKEDELLKGVDKIVLSLYNSIKDE